MSLTPDPSLVRISDYFAELYVAGRFAEAGWNVYFPHRDQGFDFIVTKHGGGGEPLIRPVQLKGKYPSAAKTDRIAYGYVGRLTLLHPEMVLAILFFARTVAKAHAVWPTCPGRRSGPTPAGTAAFRLGTPGACRALDATLRASSGRQGWPCSKTPLGAKASSRERSRSHAHPLQ